MSILKVSKVRDVLFYGFVKKSDAKLRIFFVSNQQTVPLITIALKKMRHNALEAHISALWPQEGEEGAIFTFWGQKMSRDVIFKKSGTLQTSGNGFTKNMALRSLRERIWKKYGALQTCGGRFGKNMALRKLRGRIWKKIGAMQTFVPLYRTLFRVRTVFEWQTNAVRRPLKASLLRSFQTGTLGAVVTAVVVEFDFHLGFCELSCGR